MADQTVASLTDRLADYLVNAFTDGRGYDPADPVDVAVTLKDGFAIVLAEMREDQDAGSATYLRADAERLGLTVDEYVEALRRKQRSMQPGACEVPGCGWTGPHTHAPTPRPPLDPGDPNE